MFEELLTGLASADVRFVVVGGLAVVIQGYARLTADVDLVLDLAEDNERRAIEALLARGLRPLLPVNAMDFADEGKRLSMRDEKNPLLTVDLFVRAPIPFEELWSRADRVTLGDQTVYVVSIADLIRTKRADARPQDAIDIAQLEAIARKRKLADREPGPATDWRADFRAAEERMLEASLSVTPSERLRWLEEALRFAAKMARCRATTTSFRSG